MVGSGGRRWEGRRGGGVGGGEGEGSVWELRPKRGEGQELGGESFPFSRVRGLLWLKGLEVENGKDSSKS